MDIYRNGSGDSHYRSYIGSLCFKSAQGGDQWFQRISSLYHSADVVEGGRIFFIRWQVSDKIFVCPTRSTWTLECGVDEFMFWI